MGMNHQAFTALLQDLTVIAKVGPNHQLYTHTQVMYSKEYSWWQSAYRLAMREDRCTNIARVKSIVETAISELQSLRGQEHEWAIDKKQAVLSFTEQQVRQQVMDRIKLLKDALYGVRAGGLPKLHTTYEHDSVVVSALDVLDKYIALALLDNKE